MSDTVKLTNDLLKGVMGDAMVGRADCKDFNILTPGVYHVASSSQNSPNSSLNHGMLLVFGNGSSSVITLQVYYEFSSIARIYTRLYWLKNWTSWATMEAKFF